MDRAVTWLLGDGDSNGDGFLDYRRRGSGGALQPGLEGLVGRRSPAPTAPSPTGPIALVEAQGYSYAALVGAAELAGHVTLRRSPAELRDQAEALRDRFEDRFWDERGWYALALDGAGRPVDSLTTNPGHALWSGIADPSSADRYLDRLMDDDMWTGWGLRTLASTMAAYDPLSYHNGSVWPHDTAICAAGAARYGRWDVVERIVDGALDAADALQRPTARALRRPRAQRLPGARRLSLVLLTAGLGLGVDPPARTRPAGSRARRERRAASIGPDTGPGAGPPDQRDRVRRARPHGGGAGGHHLGDRRKRRISRRGGRAR